MQANQVNAEQGARRLHPLMAGAAASVMLVSLTGVAAITGLLPTSHGTSSPSAPLAANLDAGKNVKTDLPTPAVAGKSNVANASGAAREDLAANDTDELPAAKPAVPKPAAPKQAAKPVTHQVHRAPVTAKALAPAQYAQASQNYGGPYQQPVQQPQPVYSQPQAYPQPAPPVAQQASPVGIAAGAVIGGVLGNQVGKGNGRTLATVAGAVGGGFIGNEVGKRYGY